MGIPVDVNCWVVDVPEGFALDVVGPHGNLRFGPYPSRELAELEAEELRDVIAGLLGILGFGTLVDATWRTEPEEPNGQ